MSTCKEGRLPAVGADLQGWLRLGPQPCVELVTPAQVRQVYRGVNDLTYTDRPGRPWTFTALQLTETAPNGTTQLWAWGTDLEVNRATVSAVTHQGGRPRWHIETQGFTTQKNSALNLEHAYRHGPPGAASS